MPLIKWTPSDDLIFESPILEDWVTGGVAGAYGWATQVVTTGGAVMNTTALDATHSGIVEVRSGTANGNGAAIHLGSQRIVLGTAIVIIKSLIQIPILADAATNTYVVRWGLSDNGTSDVNNGVFLEYDVTLSANWRYCHANGGSRTKTNSSTAVSTSWIKAEIRITGSTSEFFINDSSIGSIVSTNFPTASTAPFFSCTHSATGTTQRVAYIDTYYLKQTWPNGRI